MRLQMIIALATVSPWLLPAYAAAYEIDRNTNSIRIVSLADFDRCAAEIGAESCFEGLRGYVEKQPKDAFQAGKRVRLSFQHSAALPFFGRAFGKQPTAAQCADEDVSMAVLAGLALPPTDSGLSVARKIASEQCFAQLQAALLKELQAPGGYFKGNACPILTAKGVAAAECEPAKPVPTAAVSPGAASKLRGLDWSKLRADLASARMFITREEAEVYVVQVGAKHEGLYLVKFKGIRGPWDGKVLLTAQEPAGDGVNLVTLIGDTEWTVITERGGNYEAYPKDYQHSLGLYNAKLGDKAASRGSSDVMKEFSTKPGAK